MFLFQFSKFSRPYNVKGLPEARGENLFFLLRGKNSIIKEDIWYLVPLSKLFGGYTTEIFERGLLLGMTF